MSGDGGARTSTRYWVPLAVVGAFVVAANLPYLTGWADPNPLLSFSRIGYGLAHGPLPGGFTIDPNAGLTSQALAHRAALDWIHGRVPWWNPFEGLGSPLAGEMQSAAFFVPIALLLIPNGQVLLYLLLELVAAYGTYGLLRKLSVPPWACVAGAVAFGLDGTFSWLRFAPANPVCFLPVALLGVEVVRERATRGKATRWWLLALAVAGSLVAGFPETAYLDALVIVIWSLCRLPGLGDAAWRYLWSAFAGAVAGVALAAPVLVAFVDYLPHGTLGGDHYAHVAVPGGLAGLLFPYVYGPIHGFDVARPGGPEIVAFWGRVGGYLSLALVGLAALGVAGARHRALKVGLAAWSVLVVARTYGVGPAEDLFALLPGMHGVASYRYVDPGLELAVAVLAAFGVADLLAGRVGRTRLAATVAAVAGVGVAAWRTSALIAERSGAPHHSLWAAASVTWGLLTLAVIVVAGIGARRGPSPALAAVLVALLPVEAAAMLVVPELSAPRHGRVDTALAAYLRAHLGSSRFATLGPLAPNYGSYFGVAALNVNDVPTPKSFARLVVTHLDPNAWGILFTGSSSRHPGGTTPAEALARYLRDYEALGVAYVVTDAHTPLPRLPGRQGVEVYHDAVADVWRLPATAPFFSDRSPGCVVRPAGLDRASVRCPTASTLTRSELYMPGWHATVDGRAAALRPSSLSLQVVRLPAGRSEVSYSFSPPHVAWAWLAAALALLACGYSALGPRRRPGAGPAHRRQPAASRYQTGLVRVEVSDLRPSRDRPPASPRLATAGNSIDRCDPPSAMRCYYVAHGVDRNP